MQIFSAAVNTAEGSFDADQALADYTEAIRTDPKFAEAYLGLAWGREGKWDLDEALADCAEALGPKPKFAVAYCTRGSIFAAQYDLDKAIADLSEAIRLQPAYAEAYCYLAGAYLENEEYERAIADYTVAIRLKPNYYDAYACRGWVYAAQGDHDKAVADYHAAIAACDLLTRRDPKDADAFFASGAGPTGPKAITTRRSPTPAPRPSGSTRSLPAPFRNRAAVYGKKGQYEKALADLGAAIRIAPKNHGVRLPGLGRTRRMTMTRPSPTAVRPSASPKKKYMCFPSAAVSTTPRATMTRPLPTTTKPSVSSRRMPRHTPVEASPTPARPSSKGAGRFQRGRPTGPGKLPRLPGRPAARSTKRRATKPWPMRTSNIAAGFVLRRCSASCIFRPPLALRKRP